MRAHVTSGALLTILFSFGKWTHQAKAPKNLQAINFTYLSLGVLI